MFSPVPRMTLPPDPHPGHVVLVAEGIMPPPHAGRAAPPGPLAFSSTAELLPFRSPVIRLVVSVTVLAPPPSYSFRLLHPSTLLSIGRLRCRQGPSECNPVTRDWPGSQGWRATMTASVIVEGRKERYAARSRWTGCSPLRRRWQESGNRTAGTGTSYGQSAAIGGDLNQVRSKNGVRRQFGGGGTP